MTKTQMIDKISKLESMQDYLLTELERLDAQMRRIGFEDGLRTMKATAYRLIAMAQQSQEDVQDVVD